MPAKYCVALKPRAERMLGMEEAEIAVIERLPFAQSRRALDVGANWGGYTVALARRFARVEAIEPIPRCAAALRAYASAFARNVTVREVLSSDRIGSLDFVERQPDREAGDYSGFAHVAASDEHATSNIRAEPIDSYDLLDVDFIKIDVEGYERAVISGSLLTLKRSYPILLIEMEQRHIAEPLHERIAFIEALGYEARFYRYGRFAALSEFDLARDQNQTTIESDRQRYVNNFFFFPRTAISRYVAS
jgi:FkbM family methyltransferase